MQYIVFVSTGNSTKRRIRNTNVIRINVTDTKRSVQSFQRELKSNREREREKSKRRVLGTTTRPKEIRRM